MFHPTKTSQFNTKFSRAAAARSGFTIVEIIVAIVIISIMVLILTNIFITISRVQAQTNHLAEASRIAEQEIESLRNKHYNSLPVSPPPIDFTSQLPADLGAPKSATVTVSAPTAGIKRLDVVISWREGSRIKTIELSSLLGNIGISQ